MSEKLETIKFQTELKKKRTRKTFFSKNTKTSQKQIKRKRRKIKYFKSLKKVRYQRGTEDLCSAVELFDITDMNSATASYPATAPPEVLEWQRQDQLAYWKSRAISLEYENQMLRRHLRNVYAKTVEDRSLSFQVHEQGFGADENQSQNNLLQGTTSKTNENSKILKKKASEIYSEKHKEKEVVLPNVPNLKHRIEGMRELYGEKAQQIMGMETAIQLNYERHLEESKPVLWPSLPLRLNFDD